SAVAVAGVSLGLFLLRRRWPGLLIAWVSYLVILTPTFGWVGSQIVADRYSYLSTMSWVVLGAAGLYRLSQWAGARHALPAALPVAGLAVVLGLALLTWRQCATWRDSEALWSNVLAQGGGPNAHAERSLGYTLAEQGRFDEALAHCAEAVRLRPRFAPARH